MTKQNRNKIEDDNADYSGGILNLKVNLELAGIFFINALSQINEGIKKFAELEDELKRYGKNYHSKLKEYQLNSDEFITSMLPQLRNLEIYYEPVVRNFSTAKILLVCCAETYINEVSATILSGKKLEEFDKLTIVGKWIFIQDLIGFKNKMTIDKNPLQGLSLLVKERNKLVHFKGLKKSIQLLEVPNYIDDLKLIPKACLNNIKIVRDLIRDFSLNWTGSYGPDWLNAIEKSGYRNPCFFLNNREVPLILYSDKLDENRYK